MKLSKEELLIYNEGERLLPGVTHSMAELVRHQSSYEFFIRVIEEDLKRKNIYGKQSVTIADFGFGVGYGCKSLARIPNAKIVGIDISHECLEYAKKYYSAPNVTLVIADIIEYVSIMPEFDYIVSRGVVEHVHDGINVMRQSKWKNRLMMDLPYNEPYGGNQHHVVCEVTEKDFINYPNSEIFYEELSGEIYSGVVRESIPNMIMCVCSKSDFPKVSELLKFPISAWKTNCDYEDIHPIKRKSFNKFMEKMSKLFISKVEN